MPTYSFRITKGKYQLLISTTDKEFVVEQFALWVKKASDYVQKKKSREGKERIESQISAEKEITQKKIDEQLRKMPKSESVEEISAHTQDKTTELDALYTPQSQEAQTINNIVKNNFEDVLEKSVNNPQTELSFKPSPSIRKDNAFINYMSGRKIERRIDYLLLTAYYFTQYEQKPRFTLKQLNAKLMQNLAIILDHSVIQEGINRDYIECLPDLTGVIGASEYRLTAYGEKTLLDE